MRHVFLDLETTGLSAVDGDQIVEIGAVEAAGGRLTGRQFHTYLDPERAIHPHAQAVHGLSVDFLTGKPRFEQIAESLHEFVEGTVLLIHNAPFDLAFLDAAFARVGAPSVRDTAEQVIDTLPLFHGLFPGQRCSLEHVCERLRIAPTRDGKNTLTDARLLAQACLRVWETLNQTWQLPAGFGIAYLQRQYRLSYRNAVFLMNQLVVSRAVRLEVTTGGLAYVRGSRLSTEPVLDTSALSEDEQGQELLRQLALAADEIAAMARHPDNLPVDVIVTQAESRMWRIGLAASEFGMRTAKDEGASLLARVEEHIAVVDDLLAIPTGFSELDRLTGGLRHGELTVLGARSGMGATTLALNIAEHVALSGRGPVAYFSMNQTTEQLATRIASAVGRIDIARLHSGRVTDDDRKRLDETVEQLQTAKLFLDASWTRAFSAMHREIRKLTHEHGPIGLVVVDGLQLIEGVQSDDGVHMERLREAAQGLRGLAKIFVCPVLALSQVSDAVDARQNKRPTLIDLVGSTAIEPHADRICFLYRDEFYNPDTSEPGIAEVLVRKQRTGPNGSVKLAYLESYSRFDDLQTHSGRGD